MASGRLRRNFSVYSATVSSLMSNMPSVVSHVVVSARP